MLQKILKYQIFLNVKGINLFGINFKWNYLDNSQFFFHRYFSDLKRPLDFIFNVFKVISNVTCHLKRWIKLNIIMIGNASFYDATSNIFILLDMKLWSMVSCLINPQVFYHYC